jgi:hypothetical protein
MQDLNIELLAMNMSNAEGHEHRIRPIAARAAAIFAERLDNYCAEAPGMSGPRNLGSLSASPVGVDLSTMTDEQAAGSIARSWLDALALKLR